MFGETDCKVIIQNVNYLECMGAYKGLVEIKIRLHWHSSQTNVFSSKTIILCMYNAEQVKQAEKAILYLIEQVH